MNEFGVQCNVRAPHKFLRMGALATIVNFNPGSGSEKIEVSCMSRGGRIVRTWADARDFTNYRAKWLHEGLSEASRFDTKEKAQEWAEMIQTNYASDPVRQHAAAFGKAK